MVESLGIVVGQIQCKDASVGFPGPILSIAMSSPRTRDGMPLNEEEHRCFEQQFIIRVSAFADACLHACFVTEVDVFMIFLRV